MQRGDELSYRRAKNCETAVSKGHHNVGSYPLGCCGFFANMEGRGMPKKEGLYNLQIWGGGGLGKKKGSDVFEEGRGLIL